MAEETKAPAKRQNDEVVDLMLEPLKYGIASASRKALDMGCPVEKMLELHLQNLVSVLAQVEPAEARAGALADIQRLLPGLLHQAVDFRFRTPGGVILPGAQ